MSSNGAPRWPFADALEGDEFDDLRLHLESSFSHDLSAPELSKLVAAVEYSVTMAKLGSSARGEDLRKAEALEREHFSDLARKAISLKDALAGGPRPLWATEGLEWNRFDRWLKVLVESASAHASSEEPPRRGGPSKDWRDSMVATIWAHYPRQDELDPRSDPRFTKIIGLVLDALDQPATNVPQLIGRALVRRSESPVAIEFTSNLRK